MKFARLLLFFLLSVIAVTAILSFMLPTRQKIERSIVINSSAAGIYNQLNKLENFNKFSVWSQQDSSAIYTLSGLDGTIGATSSWKGSPEISGEGKIEIAELGTNKKVVHKIHFTKPQKGTAESIFTLLETNLATTTVTWTFYISTPRPWNIFNLFSSLDKQMGKDFEDGLAAMKAMIELSDNQIMPGNNQLLNQLL